MDAMGQKNNAMTEYGHVTNKYVSLLFFKKTTGPTKHVNKKTQNNNII